MLTYRVQSALGGEGLAPAVVLLHGIGSHEQDLFTLAPYFPPSYYVFSLRAPYSYPWGGFSWFDLDISSQGVVGDPTMAAHSRQAVEGVRQEILGRYPLDPEHLYLVGFSQGAMVSLSLLSHSPETWAGVVAMSGAVLPELCPPPRDPDLAATKPILWIHGEQDTVIPLSYGAFSRDYLRHYALTYRTFPMGHEVSATSLQVVIETLRDWTGGSGRDPQV